jgi:membrane protein
VVELRRRSRAADALVGTLDGFRVHQSATGTYVVTYFGFISLFPLFLVFTTILGFVLQDDQQLQEDIVDSALANLPLIGDTLASTPGELEGSVTALVVGLVLALWTSMKAFVALQRALDNIDEVPLDERHRFAEVRLRALAAIAVVGLAQAGGVAISAVAAASSLPAYSRILLFLATALLNTAVLAATYRALTSTRFSWSTVLPGAVLAGVAFSLLQVAGTAVIARTQANAAGVYGDFATVIALLAWLSLHAVATLLGAEFNRALNVSPYWTADGERVPDAPAAADRDPDAAAVAGGLVVLAALSFLARFVGRRR